MTYEFKIEADVIDYEYQEKLTKLLEIDTNDIMHTDRNIKKYFTELMNLKKLPISKQLLDDLASLDNKARYLDVPISEYSINDLLYYGNLDEKLSKTRFKRFEDQHTFKIILTRIELFCRIKKKAPKYTTKAFEILTTKKVFSTEDKNHLKKLL